MHIAAGRGRQPQGTKFWCQQKPFVTSVICYRFKKKISLKSGLIHFFSCVYSPGAGLTTPWDNIFMSTGTSFHFGNLWQVSKKSLWSVILYTSFSWFYTWDRGKQPPGDIVLMSTEMPFHFIHLLQVSKQCFWNLILYIFFHDLIHVYNPGAAADSPQGTKSLMSTERPYHLPICCKFQRNLFEVWFYTVLFAWFNICI